MENTIKNLKKIKVDAVYGKKKHFNAADRKQGYHTAINITNLIFEAIISILLFVILYTENFWLKIISLIFAATVTVLIGFQIRSNYCKMAEGHRSVGNRYLALFKKCVRLEGYIKDNLIENNSIPDEIEGIADEIDKINIDAEIFPTSDNDYKKAKKGIESGEEDYTDEEFKVGK